MKNFIFLSFLLFVLVAFSSCQKDEYFTADVDSQIEDVDFRGNPGHFTIPIRGVFTGVGGDPTTCPVVEGINPVKMVFDGRATLFGKSSYESCQYNVIEGVDPETGYLLFSTGGIPCPFKLTAANGDYITGYYADTRGELREDGNIYFWGTHIVTPEGNTGRFECASGELPFHGNTQPGPNIFYLEGGYLDLTNDDCEGPI